MKKTKTYTVEQIEKMLSDMEYPSELSLANLVKYNTGFSDFLEASPTIVKELLEEIERLEAKMFKIHSGRELLMMSHQLATNKTREDLIKEMEAAGSWAEYDD